MINTDVYLLTPEQADLLRNELVQPDNYFNPIQDDDGNWVISQQEVDQCQIQWVKSLQKIQYKPKQDQSWQEKN
jgi:hypothetical protein